MSEKDEVKIIVSNRAITYAITLPKWAINCNTRDFLKEETIKFIDNIFDDMESKDE